MSFAKNSAFITEKSLWCLTQTIYKIVAGREWYRGVSQFYGKQSPLYRDPLWTDPSYTGTPSIQTPVIQGPRPYRSQLYRDPPPIQTPLYRDPYYTDPALQGPILYRPRSTGTHTLQTPLYRDPYYTGPTEIMNNSVGSIYILGFGGQTFRIPQRREHWYN